MTNQLDQLIPPHGGYRSLLSYQSATVVYDFTVEFCKVYMSHKSNMTNKTYTRTYDQMVQAARSGRQNIAEGSQVSGTSKKTELKLVGVARASQAELLADFEDFLRQNNLVQWAKDDPRVQQVRALAYKSNRSYKTYESYLTSPETAANAAICLIHQTNYLLDRQLSALGQQFLEQGGFTERLYEARRSYRTNKTNRA